MIEASFNQVGMLIFYCNHVKGYDKGKGKNICRKCELKILNIIPILLKSKKEKK